MNHQILMGTTFNAPVQAPFQHRECFAQRKGAEWCFIIEAKEDVRADPTPEALRLVHANMKISKLRIFYNCEIRIKQVDRAGQEFDGGLEMCLEGTQA